MSVGPVSLRDASTSVEYFPAAVVQRRKKMSLPESSRSPHLLSHNSNYGTMPIDVVCAILKFAAQDKDTVLSLVTISKAIHNLILPFLYGTVYLRSQWAAKRFTVEAPRPRTPGCSRPCVRYLNTTSGCAGAYWYEIAYLRPEIEHLCVSMLDLHAIASKAIQLQPTHLGIIVDGIHLFPDYKKPPSESTPRYIEPDQHVEHHRQTALTVTEHQPHASLFLWTTHIYFVDNIPPNLGCLRPYLQCLTHFSFAYRRDYGVQFTELIAVLRAVLDIPSVQLVLVVRQSRTPWSEREQRELKHGVPESADSRVVLFDGLQGLTWDENEEAIWHFAEDQRLRLNI